MDSGQDIYYTSLALDNHILINGYYSPDTISGLLLRDYNYHHSLNL